LTAGVRLSEFWRLLDEEFGTARARALADHHVLAALGSPAELTPAKAIDRGVDPARVWEALCDDFQVPVERRLGKDRPLRRDGRSIGS